MAGRVASVLVGGYAACVPAAAGNRGQGAREGGALAAGGRPWCPVGRGCAAYVPPAAVALLRGGSPTLSADALEREPREEEGGGGVTIAKTRGFGS
jgi:hypothetical protein